MGQALPVDRFRQATAGTLRAIAGRADLAVSFTGRSTGCSDSEVRLPPPPPALAYDEVMRMRGEADSIALWLRHHDRSIHARYTPDTALIRAAFDALETVRVESLGCKRRNGISRNLAAWHQACCQAQGYDLVTKCSASQFAVALSLLLGELIMGQKPPDAARTLVNLWRPRLEPELRGAARGLGASLDNQSDYARKARSLLSRLGLSNMDLTPDPLLVETSKNMQQLLMPQITGGGVEDSDVQLQLREEPGTGIQSVLESSAGRKPGRQPVIASSVPSTVELPYSVYTTAYDEVVHARSLAEAEELSRWRRYLDDRLGEFVRVIGPLANRLQRKLLARQQLAWRFDLEEGELDSARLGQLVASPSNARPYRQRVEAEYRGTVVTLLIDNSGSMRGRPITVAAMSADILARTLERCGVKVEILGFTTRDWKGGKAREQWLAGQVPAAPGRLNSVRHIIYKDASESWRRARNNLGLMLRESLLKENIDGEAILWAHQRLMQRPEQRRILMVISDGAPVDDSTLSANHGKYLEQHLKHVIDWVERISPVELLAIGIGHDVRHYYRHATTIDDVEQLGNNIINQLSVLFNYKESADEKSL
ncbi:MAG: hypothetical protein QF783_05905 [Arenicellales bacterium]|nr:hypothetical protein [Arenicellales bacterium]